MYQTSFCRCFEVNGCPGIYWHARQTCSNSVVASVSYYTAQRRVFLIFNFQAISALDNGAKTKTKIKVESNGSPKVNVEFMEQSNELEDYKEDPQLSKLPNNIPIKTTVYQPASTRVHPVFWSNKHFLSISQFASPSGISV